MSFFKQIALIVSGLLLVLLTIVLALNFQSTKDMIQDTLTKNAINTTSSMAVSLSENYGTDFEEMNTYLSAVSSGDYSYLALEDENGRIVTEYKSDLMNDMKLYIAIETESSMPDAEGEVLENAIQNNYEKMIPPNWFLEKFHLEIQSVSAPVGGGWSAVSGKLSIQPRMASSYIQLYSIFKKLLLTFGSIALISLGILYLILRTNLKPLKEVQKQAEAVGRNEFILQGDIPNTAEFKDVVLGMNNMVTKVQAMFNKGNEELKRQKELEYIDPTTKLRNRKYLVDKLPEFLKIDATSEGGVNIMAALSGLIEANEQIGHRSVDDLFVSIADIFRKHASKYEDAIIARMNGTEFSLFLPDCEADDALAISKNISNDVIETIEAATLDTSVVFIALGAFEYTYKQNIGQLLSGSDNALAQAKFHDEKIHLVRAEEEKETMGKDDWRAIINKALENNSFKFASWTAVDAKAKQIAHHALSLTLQDGEKTYYYGQFMAPANQIGMSSKIYQNIMNMLFKNPDAKLKNTVCSLRLSYEYLDMRETYLELTDLLKNYADKLPLKLIIEIPDKMFRQNSLQINEYKSLFEKHNIEMGVYEFIGESTDYQYLQDLRPVYIKGESSYFLSQTDQALSALRLITDTVGITLIATGVMDLETLEQLQQKDVYVIQGRATEMVELS